VAQGAASAFKREVISGLKIAGKRSDRKGKGASHHEIPPFAFAAAVCAATFGLSQSLVPTVMAQSAPAPHYRVRIEWEKASRIAGGLTVRGKITNTGSRSLIYTQVAPLLVDAAGRVVYRTSGYLTVSPLPPGASAEFRACGPEAPAFAGLHTAFHEAGQPVIVEEAFHRIQ